MCEWMERSKRVKKKTNDGKNTEEKALTLVLFAKHFIEKPQERLLACRLCIVYSVNKINRIITLNLTQKVFYFSECST